tara:strand:+ start:406 stop:1275 length:870 start_codon:yes stop_codon:yes gene_type:complete
LDEKIRTDPPVDNENDYYIAPKRKVVSNFSKMRMRINFTPSLELVTIAISTSNLQVHYGQTLALAGVDLEVPKGSLLSVIGPNGAGKSALLNALAGTVEVSDGTVTIEGGTPALVLQATQVDRSLQMTVRDVVSLARYYRKGLLKRFRASDRDTVQDSLKRMSIEHLAQSQFHELSGGERQRVLVAQGLAQDADVLLLDEPINGLDIVSRSLILDAIEEEKSVGKTVVVTTHNLDDARNSNQVLLLCTSPCCVGSPHEVLTEEHLNDAFGGQHIRVGQSLIVEDPHHAH